MRNALPKPTTTTTTHPLRRNILLLFAKIAAFVISSSYSVLASTIDSVVDLLSQIMVALAER